MVFYTTLLCGLFEGSEMLGPLMEQSYQNLYLNSTFQITVRLDEDH